jgi:hypothetical protein
MGPHAGYPKGVKAAALNTPENQYLACATPQIERKIFVAVVDQSARQAASMTFGTANISAPQTGHIKTASLQVSNEGHRLLVGKLDQWRA